MQDLSSLKITFLAASLGVSGAEKQLFYILTSLRKLGADVDLISFQAGEHWEEPLRNAGISVRTLVEDKDIYSRISAIGRILRQSKPDFIQSQHLSSSYHAAFSGMLEGVNTIGASRGFILDEMNDAGILGNLCVSLPDHLVVNSIPSFRLAIDQGRPDRTVHYLPNAIDAPELLGITRAGNSSGPVKILTVGRCVKEKRFDRFIRLIARLKAEYGPGKMKGILVGDGPLLPEHQRLAADLELTDNDLEFAGMTTDTAPYYKEADIFVLTSDTEGTPNVILEAMSAALPVVCTDVGNIPYMFENNQEGYAVSPVALESMAAVIDGLINNAELRLRIGEKGRSRVRREFSTEALSRNLLNLYKALIIGTN